MRGLSESLWAELRDTRVGVTSVHPGGIATNIAAAVRTTDEAQREALVASFARYGHPPDAVARAVLRGITREKLRVIVGWEAHAADWLKRLLPVGSHRLFGRRVTFGDSGKT